MLRSFLIIFSFFVLQTAGAQDQALTGFEKERSSITKKGMAVLCGWSAANIITGAVATNTSNKELHYFHQMNMLWNGVNLTLGGLGYLDAANEKISNSKISEVLHHQNKTEKLFLFNAGLDIAYITGGFYLKERSRRQADPSKLRGYGNSILMQGAFLLLLDGTMYAVHHHHAKKLDAVLDHLSLSGGTNGLSLTVNF